VLWSRAREETVRLRLQSGASGRPLSFAVRWQVPDATLLGRTHQWWKLRLATIGVVVSLVLQFLPRLGTEDLGARTLFAYSAVSVLLAAGSLALLFWGVSCPQCHAKWAQLAARQPSGLWLKWLCDLRVCPQCGWNGVPPDNRWRGP